MPPNVEFTAAPPAVRVVVMGVSGSGKSTVGELLAERLGVEYADADDFHSATSRAKLQAGVALTDADREPWLRSIGSWLADRGSAGGVVSCSALKRRYRDILRACSPGLVLLYCEGSRELIAERMAARRDHFMPPSLLESQFTDLEQPDDDEDPITVDVALPPAEVVDVAVSAMTRRKPREGPA
jgi:gluconokinase